MVASVVGWLLVWLFGGLLGPNTTDTIVNLSNNRLTTAEK